MTTSDLLPSDGTLNWANQKAIYWSSNLSPPPASICLVQICPLGHSDDASSRFELNLSWIWGRLSHTPQKLRPATPTFNQTSPALICTIGSTTMQLCQSLILNLCSAAPSPLLELLSSSRSRNLPLEPRVFREWTTAARLSLGPLPSPAKLSGCFLTWLVCPTTFNGLTSSLNWTILAYSLPPNPYFP